jgi:hypothetical protein
VLKSGREIEKLRERDMERMKVLILVYSVIADKYGQYMENFAGHSGFMP